MEQRRLEERLCHFEQLREQHRRLMKKMSLCLDKVRVRDRAVVAMATSLSDVLVLVRVSDISSS